MSNPTLDINALALLADQLAIEHLIARYNQSLDRGDYATWLDCWTDDAVLDGLGRLLTGKAQITEFANAYDGLYRLKLNGLKHYTVNVLSTVAGDQAQSSSYLQLLATGPKGVNILFTGRYQDSLRRDGGQWRFARRQLHQDMPPPAKA